MMENICNVRNEPFYCCDHSRMKTWPYINLRRSVPPCVYGVKGCVCRGACVITSKCPASRCYWICSRALNFVKGTANHLFRRCTRKITCFVNFCARIFRNLFIAYNIIFTVQGKCFMVHKNAWYLFSLLLWEKLW